MTSVYIHIHMCTQRWHRFTHCYWDQYHLKLSASHLFCTDNTVSSGGHHLTCWNADLLINFKWATAQRWKKEKPLILNATKWTMLKGKRVQCEIIFNIWLFFVFFFYKYLFSRQCSYSTMKGISSCVQMNLPRLFLSTYLLLITVIFLISLIIAH